MDHYLCAGQKNIKKKKKRRVGCGIYSHTTQQGDTQRTKLYALYLFFFHLSYIPSPILFLIFFGYFPGSLYAIYPRCAIIVQAEF